ncbi:response regulator transcription factor [Mesobacillus selenatarsenatis]|uniref:Two-component response regulator yesN n=1 Tax=Mesobacillus selenatarsenatis (strain DSM 18680 / JCM 14380 / FERM P-15431 / SF-1) TaxID=1321606 RepID=A0A0A8X8J5_MESS1|nr:response regulator [Mesobacillus selenatarsenatis]GAM16280.1 two-component response regulator yesN [Mesobacillus selenatarsenatis SF-1]
MLSKNIVIVDDEPRTRQGLQRTLESWNNGEYIILTAESGEDVLRIAEERKIHILLSDIRMPEMTGLQLLKTLKEKGMKPVVIVISAYSEFEYAQQALKLGVINYLLKPIGKKKLIEAVEDAVKVMAKQERAGLIEKVVDEKIVDASNKMDSTKDTIRKAMIYIDQNLKEEITLKDVAAQVHLNPSYFSVLFKEQVDLNFSEYVTRRRIQRAKELVLSTTLPINEIAEDVGYKTSKYFIKIFKEIEGMTPSAYRKTGNERAF